MSKGNYYNGSPLGQRMSDDNEWASVILAIIITGAITGIVFSIKSCTDNKNNKQKTEQTIQESKIPQQAIVCNNIVKSR